MARRPTVSLTLLILACPFFQLSGHETSRRAFQLARQLAQSQAAATAEDAEQIRKLPQCRLLIDVVDAESQQSVPAVVRIINAETGKAIPLFGEIHRGLNWYSLDAKSTISLPQMKLKIEALRGLDTTQTTRVIDLREQAKSSITIPLHRFYAARFRGLRSGNTHLHLMKLTHEEAIRYLRVVPQSDDLDLVFLSHLRRIPDERHYISNRIVEESFTGGNLQRLSQHGVLLGGGEEHRHNFGRGGEGYGHVMLLDIAKLIRPVSLGPGIMRDGTDGIPLRRGIREARAEEATVIWCHNDFGMEDLPNWLAGLVHAQNIFDGSERGSYEDSFYRYLNLGMRVPFSTGTDWFIYDFARVYVPVDGELTTATWLSGLRNGKSFITNGPLLELESERAHVGETLDLTGPNEVTFVARGMGRRDFKALELVCNGKVVHRVETVPHEGYFVAEMRHGLQISEPGWVAVRVPREAGQSELGRQLFAHTSPIYIAVAGKQIFRADVAKAMIDELTASKQTIGKKGVFADALARQGIMQIYDDAIADLARQIKHHDKQD